MHRKFSDALIVTPLLDSAQIGPSSIDLRLGTEFLLSRRYSEQRVDPFDLDTLAPPTERVSIPFGGAFVLHPREFVLGATFEFLRLPNNLSGHVLGRSSWGRLGLVVATAVVVQAGFKGCLTLELTNEANVPLVLRPGLRIAQLCLWHGRAVSAGYDSGTPKYNAPLGPESSRLGVETDELRRLGAVASRLAGEEPGTAMRREVEVDG